MSRGRWGRVYSIEEYRERLRRESELADVEPDTVDALLEHLTSFVDAEPEPESATERACREYAEHLIERIARLGFDTEDEVDHEGGEPFLLVSLDLLDALVTELEEQDG